MSDSVKAPWDQDVVDNLNRYQNSSMFHSFTCPNRDNGNHHKGDDLIATSECWICPSCEYTQSWAWAFMCEFTEEVFLERERQMKSIFGIIP